MAKKTPSVRQDRAAAKRKEEGKQGYPLSVRVVGFLMAFLLLAGVILLWPDSPQPDLPAVQLPSTTLPSITQSTEPAPLPVTSVPPTTSIPLPEPQPFSNYCATENSIIISNLESKAVIVFDGETVLNMKQAYYKSQISMDGKIAAVLFADNSLYLATGGQLIYVDSNVDNDFKLSTLGKGIVYSVRLNEQKGRQLRLFVPETNQQYRITDYSSELQDFIISPDGTAVAYAWKTTSNAVSKLFCFHDGDSRLLAQSEESLISLSNGGEYLHTYGLYEGSSMGRILRRYDSKGGYTDIAYNVEAGFHFNLDHTQVLYYSNGGTWLADPLRENASLSDYKLTPVVPSDTSKFSHSSNYSSASRSNYTLPYQDLRSNTAYYTGNGMSLYYFSSYGKRELTSAVYNYALAAGGQHLFYVKNSCLYITQLNNNYPVLLAEDIDTFSLQISPCTYESGYGPVIGFSYEQGDATYCGWFNTETTAVNITALANSWSTPVLSQAFSRDGLCVAQSGGLVIYTPDANRSIACSADFVSSSCDGILRVLKSGTYYVLNGEEMIPYGTIVYTLTPEIKI